MYHFELDLFVRIEPRKGTETLNNHTNMIIQTFVRIEPRKGTETIGRNTDNTTKNDVCKNRTPEGDGNNAVTILFLLLQNRL